jgi:hypothetical protein|nr:MAG TPA: pentapeptide repeat protein [Caudoviricetes sp.]
MENNTVQNVVHGFKVFRPDWTCNSTGYNPKQYTCPGKFEEEGELDVCGHGMHFCQTAADCFNYYNFDSNNKVAEVIAYGEVLTEGDKSCTDKLEIVREIPWDEVLRIVNFGKNCTGYCNTGDYNTGDYNTGKCNTGDFNTGSYNTGIHNVGSYNTGIHNVGRCNTGDYNAGDYNTGDFNIGRYNVGCFNTKEKKIMLFDKPSNMTFCEWMGSEARYLLNQMPKGVVEWVYEVDMTDEEKEQHPSYETTGGYLKVLDESECGQIWWGSLSDRQKNIIKAIPNFDAEIFFQCTGIRVDE